MFAGGLIAFLAVAALVFDVGQNLLDWRAQRDAADAAALAGARYISEDACVAAPSIANCPTAYAAAIRVARLNGYGDLDGDAVDDRGHVDVYIPPRESPYNVPGLLEVNIHTDRPSFFAAVLGVLQQNVDALAIAGNSDSIAPPYSILALNEDCDPNPSVQVGGNGVTDVDGAVLVNSSCEGALKVNGQGSLVAPECAVVGSATEDGKDANLDCGVLDEDFDGTTDPLIDKGPGAMPGTPAPVDILFHPGGPPVIPAGCPGSTVDINFSAAAYAALASVAMPGYTIGDIALVFAYRSGSDTPPDLPAGWTNIDAGGNDLNSSRVGYRILDGSETTTGTWTNATAIEVIVLSGQDTGAPIGDHQSAGSAGTTMTTPALTLTPTPTATSWVVAFAGASDGANDLTDTLSGTNWLSGGVSSLALHTDDNVTSWTQRDYGGSVVGPNRTHAIEVLANPAPSTAANPVGCTLAGAGGGRYNVFRLHPGVYYGGIHLAGGRARVYLAPGTYWLAGGGLTVTGNHNQLISDSVASGTPTATGGRGVFIYDTEDTYYHDQCAIDPNFNNGCIGDIHVAGSATDECTDPPQPVPPSWTPNPPTQACQWVHLEPASSPVVPITNLLIFVDRAFSGVNVFFNGDAGKLELAGTIYDPWGEVKVNGGAGDTMSAQIIAYTIKITGNGDFEVTYDADGVVQLAGAGLVK
jgi:hypothetical protein